MVWKKLKSISATTKKRSYKHARRASLPSLTHHSSHSHSGLRRASYLDAHGSGSDSDASGDQPRRSPTFRPPIGMESPAPAQVQRSSMELDVPPTPPPPLGAPPPGSVNIERPVRRRSSIDSSIHSISEDVPSSPRPRPRRRGRRATLDDGLSQSAVLRNSLMGGGNLNTGPTFRPPSSSEEPLDASVPRGADQSSGHNGGNNEAGLSRRTSMSDMEQAQRRASIKQIMQDGRLNQLEKRRSIQMLMDGRRRSTIDCGQTNPISEALRRESLSRRRTNSFDDGTEGSSVGGSMNRRSTDMSMESVEHQAPVAVRPFGNSTAPWAGAENNAASAEASALSGPASAPWPGNSAPPALGRPYSPSTFSNSDEYIHVPDHAPAAASAIAAAHLQTRSEAFAAKHPYNATSTKVPAVAAGASEAHPHNTKMGRRGSNVEFARRAIETAPPCTHYDRKCHIVSPCCGATFGCRICHDDCPVLPPLLDATTMEGMLHDAASGGMGGGAGGGDGPAAGGRKYQRVMRTSSMPTSLSATIAPPEHHNLDRFAIKEIICRECFTKQSSKTNFCVNCNVRFGEYHCAICNLWMSNEERPYHCPDCGFCRVGGGENFRHCDDCGMCIDRQLFADHNCKVGKYMSNCPVCQEDLFSSRDASHELPCGHAIHWHCFRELASHDSRCPMCKKTAETHERMKPTWDAMAMGIQLQPVPPELCKVVTIKCNDCEEVQHNRSWHFLGVQCQRCESFNTVVERITMMGQEAHEFLSREDPPQAGIGGGGAAATGPQVATGEARRRRRRATMDMPPSGGGMGDAPEPPFG